MQHLGLRLPANRRRLPGSTAAPPGSACLPLPVEIWLLIAGNLNPDEKIMLMGVNRVFYELAMDERYCHLNLVSEDPWLFIDTMETLRCVLAGGFTPPPFCIS
jgi:hypothetical protein